MEGINNHIDELHKHATRAAYSTTSSSNSAAGSSNGGASRLKVPQKPMEGIPGFFNALGKVIRRDLGIIDHTKK